LKKATGALVSEPQLNSPAAKAGIISGDVITSVDGNSVADARELARRIGIMAPGTTIKLGLTHQGEEKTVSLTLGTLPAEHLAANQQNERPTADSEIPKLGLKLAVGNSSDQGSGVLVTGVDPNGIAADHGFQVGDLILDVGGKAVSKPADVAKQVAEARKEGKHALLFRVKSGEGTRFVALPLGNA
jgi:serine protease Do